MGYHYFWKHLFVSYKGLRCLSRYPTRYPQNSPSSTTKPTKKKSAKNHHHHCGLLSMPPPNRWQSPAKHLTIPHRTLKLRPLPEQTSIASRVEPKRHWGVSEGKLPSFRGEFTLPETNMLSIWKWMVGIRSFPFGARPICRREMWSFSNYSWYTYLFQDFQTKIWAAENAHWVWLFQGVWFHMVSGWRSGNSAEKHQWKDALCSFPRHSKCGI